MAEPHTISGDTHFGETVIKEGYASPVQVQECLRIKSDLAERGTPRQLGAIMVERGYLTIQQVEEILDKQQKRVLECPSCGGRFTVRGYESDKEYSCPRCGSMLSAPAEESDPAQLQPVAEPSAPRLDPENLVNQTIGGCKVLEKLAIGGMGTIYKARQLSMNRIVVVKTLSEDLAKDKAYVQRFLQEARAAGELSHTNLIHVMDVGYQDGVFYYIMEFIDGINLDTILAQKGRVPVDQAIDVIIQTARALEQAHSRNIIHRDIKPDNIMITRDGVVKLADLGIAKKISGDMGVTEPGMVLGTPFYMAPEQGRDSRSVDHRSDIYGLGATFYHMLSGNVPFDGKTTLEIVMKSIEEDPQPLKQADPSLPDDIVAVIEKMMKKRPEERYQSMSEVISDLERIRAHKPLGWVEKKPAREVTPPPVKAVAKAAPPSSGGTKKHADKPSPPPRTDPDTDFPPPQRTPQTPPAVAKPVRLSAARRRELGLDDSDLDEGGNARPSPPPRPVAPGRPLPQRAAPAPAPSGNVSPILADSQGATPGKIYKERQRDIVWPIVTVVFVAISVFVAVHWLRKSTNDENVSSVGPPMAHDTGDQNPTTGRTSNENARKELAKADEYVQQFPIDYDTQIENYDNICKAYPATVEADDARKKRDGAKQRREEAIQKDYANVQAQIDAARASSHYTEALVALDDFGKRKIPEEWKKKVQKAADDLIAEATAKCDAIVAQADKDSQEGLIWQAIDDLEKVRDLGIESLTATVESRIAQMNREANEKHDAAEARYRSLRDASDARIKPMNELLWKLKLDDAKKRLETIASDPGVKVVTDEIRSDIKDIDTVGEVLQAARDGVKKKKGEPCDLRQRGGEQGRNPMRLGKGKFLGIDGDTITFADEQGRSRTAELTRLVNDDIIALAQASLQPEEVDTKRKIGVYYFVMDDPSTAETFLKAAASAGAEVGTYLSRIEDTRIRPRMPKEPRILYYSTRGESWEEHGGVWTPHYLDCFIEGGETPGDYYWKPMGESAPEEYVLSARAKKVSGINGFTIGFHAFGREMRWSLGDQKNTMCWVEGVPATQHNEGVEDGRWYTLQLVVTKDMVVGYVNRKRQWRIDPEDVKKAEPGMPAPGIGMGVVSTRAYFRDFWLWPLK